MNKRNPLATLILASLVMLLIFIAPASAAVLQADFTADPTSGNAPLVVLFTDKSVGNASVYNWDFGDGGTSRNKYPGHTYLQPGNYTVTLKITKGSYYSTASHTITIPDTDPAIESPMAHLTAVSKTGTAPFTVQFTDKSTGGPTAWMWYFGNGDGALSREQNPTYTYTKPGVYTVSLQVWNSQGACSEKFVNYITVMPANNAPVANAGSDQVVEQTNPTGADVTLNGSGSTDDGQISPLTYTWTWNGGSAEGMSPVVTLPTGTTTVTLTVFDGELSSTDTVDIKVNPAQLSSITSTNFHVPTTFGSNGYDYIWFNSNFKASGVKDGTTIYFTGSQITAKDNVKAPNAIVTFSSTVTKTSTHFDSNKNAWITTVPLSGTDDIFLSGMLLPIQSGDWPSNNQATWSGYFSTNTAGVSLSWKFGSAVYTNDGGGYNNLGVKASHNNAEGYNNGDHAGTPENLKSYLVAGGSGGGGSNWCGSWSGTKSVNP